MEISKSIEIIKSLADTSRLQVLNALMDKPQYVEELSHRLNLAVSTVSFHLKKLENAGLVNKTKDQYYFIYAVNSDIFDLPLKEIVRVNNIEIYVQNERINKYREKVLNTFFKKGKLLKLPVQHKKKLIILDEFIKYFKTEKEYKEKEVDAIINQVYGDHCTIRRLLIEEGMMTRKNQTYRLIKIKEEQNA